MPALLLVSRRLINLPISFGLMLLACASQAAMANSYQRAHVDECGTMYYQKTTPQPLADKAPDIYYLCFNGFAVGYSPTSKTAIWSAERLTRARIEQANTLERDDNFHEESRLPDSVKATLADYKQVPYDRGHLAPNADMPTREAQYDSFSLANIIPQNPKNNRGAWRSLESRTRYMAVKYGDIYVVTGVAFTNPKLKKIHNRVLVPSHLYKAIYVPKLQQAGVYYTPNDDSQRVEVISLNELALRTGMDVMPAVPSNVQKIAMPLAIDSVPTTSPTPPPTTQPTDPNLRIIIVNIFMAILEWLITLLKN